MFYFILKICSIVIEFYIVYIGGGGECCFFKSVVEFTLALMSLIASISNILNKLLLLRKV